MEVFSGYFLISMRLLAVLHCLDFQVSFDYLILILVFYFEICVVG